VVAEGEVLEDCSAKTGKLGRTTANALEDRYSSESSLPGGHLYCDAESYTQALQWLDERSECLNRRVPLGIIDAFPPSGSSADITVYGIATFYIAGWSFPPDPENGYVWGYLLRDVPASPAWKVQWSETANPFAPVGSFLVE
jgi:hypothetical protein